MSSWYRKTVWNYKGQREWTRTGFEAARTHFKSEDLEVDCTGRHYMITGCNRGIGFETACEIAKRGGILHMVCRDLEAAKEARSHVITYTGNDKITLYQLELGKPREVLKWVKDWVNTHDQLHVLINNAGCMIHQRQVDNDDIETNFAVNTLAVHILTTALIPLLQKCQDSRVITVSSAGMLTLKLDPHDLSAETMEPFLGAVAYSQNKRQQVAMTLCYAQNYDRVHFSVMHPGWADTHAVRTSIPGFWEQMKNNLRTASQGADTVVWLAVSEAATKHPSGFFFQDRAICPTHLPLAWTRTTGTEEVLLMKKLDDIIATLQGTHHQPLSQPDADDLQPSQENQPVPTEPVTPQLVIKEPQPQDQHALSKTGINELKTSNQELKKFEVECPESTETAPTTNGITESNQGKLCNGDITPTAEKEIIDLTKLSSNGNEQETILKEVETSSSNGSIKEIQDNAVVETILNGDLDSVEETVTYSSAIESEINDAFSTSIAEKVTSTAEKVISSNSSQTSEPEFEEEEEDKKTEEIIVENKNTFDSTNLEESHLENTFESSVTLDENTQDPEGFDRTTYSLKKTIN